MGAKQRWGIRTPKERLLSLCIRGSETECWPWKKRTVNRYPIFNFEGYLTTASRVSHRIFIGPIPDGMEVCHKCDNPQCVNPNHLWIGSHGDNMRDARKKGRLKSPPGRKPGWKRKTPAPRGDLCPSTKYSDAFVEKLRSKFVRYKYTSRDLASEFGISEKTVRNLIYRQRYPQEALR